MPLAPTALARDASAARQSFLDGKDVPAGMVPEPIMRSWQRAAQAGVRPEQRLLFSDVVTRSQWRRAEDRQTPGTAYTFAVGGKAKAPAFTPYPMAELVSGVKYDAGKVQEGQKLYVNNCVFCHGVPGVDKGGNIPNLAYVGAPVIEHLDKFVFNGPFVQKGMPDFTGKLTVEDVAKIQAFILGTADAVRPKRP
ncbi:hypothetical protein LMG26411_06441 [Cupriavidus numazuensis]|uniref:Cytochrome c domain-containing protein n=1 Tax=Cupriavidus numazuensis TaxID=221992 RepID=A0ABM8TS31_9BURK|nr:hypothetical protein LMG26411_06441 [Cupriavidus numazuensis]